MSNSEQLAEVLKKHADCLDAAGQTDRHQADAILASNALAQMLAEARAEALREAADVLSGEWVQQGNPDAKGYADWLRDRAALTERTTDA